jgi:hypothetical protein
MRNALFGLGVLAMVTASAASAADVRPTAAAFGPSANAFALQAPAKSHIKKKNDVVGLPLIILGALAVVGVVVAVAASDGGSSPG